MPHKLDRKRHKLRVRAGLRRLKQRYLKVTQGDTLAPDKVLAVLKDSDEVDRVKRLARRLGRRGVSVQLYSDR